MRDAPDGNRDRPIGADRGDAAAVDQDGLAGARRGAGTVDDEDMLDHGHGAALADERRRLGCGLRSRATRRHHEQEQSEK